MKPPKLIFGWRRVLKRAWSVRAALGSAAFAGAAMALPTFADKVPREWFLVLCIVCSLGAVVCRVFDQGGVDAE